MDLKQLDQEISEKLKSFPETETDSVWYIRHCKKSNTMACIMHGEGENFSKAITGFMGDNDQNAAIILDAVLTYLAINPDEIDEFVAIASLMNDKETINRLMR